MKLKHLFLVSILIILIDVRYSYGQSNNFWTKTSLQVSKDKTYRTGTDETYFTLDLAGLKDRALRTQDKATDIVIAFPTANGQFKEFSVSKASILPSELEYKYPGIYSFAGRGIDDPSATIRFSVSDYNGVAGIILSNNKTTYIEPQNKGNLYHYKVYSEIDTSFKFKCKTSELGKKVVSDLFLKSHADKSTSPFLRIYRAAILADYDYGTYFAGTGTDQQKRANILAAINSTLTIINAVYERDLSVRLMLAEDNDKILFFDSIPNSGKSIKEIINDSIGYNNYEIGHTLGLIYDVEFQGMYEGNAGCIGCICTEDKGIAWTIGFMPESPVFALIVAHEMGHQMGAYHVQSSPDCISGNGQSEVEPGSGSTIMGYGGICSPNVEFAPDGYFNQISIRQISNYIYTLSCGLFSDPGNSAPTANAGPDYTIPKSTPFILTGQGTDPDGDHLTYTWEQNDPQVYDYEYLEDPRDLDRDYPAPFKTNGPMFRSYPPSESNVRMVPNLQTVLSDGFYPFEVLPSVSRELNFVLTVRDNNPGAGRCEFDSMKIFVDGNSGPFTFSSSFNPNVWQGGSLQQVTWDVAGTNAIPIRCQNVKISLSIDGGKTFPYVLISSTPNDGSEDVTVPGNISSTKCRLKIEPVNNIFYAISKKDFSITTGGCLVTVPDSLHIKRLGADYTTLAWIRGNNPAYELRYRQEGGTWNTKVVPDRQGNYLIRDSILNLASSVTYEAQVRSICNGMNTITVRARGVTGQEHINLKINNNTIGSFNLSSSFQNYSFQTNQNGGITIHYDNDQGNRDVVVDYIIVNGEVRQAEAQSVNTAAYANGRCGGGSYTEWMHCNGYIGFDNVNKNSVTIRARGTLGGEHINLRINNNIVASFNLSTSFQNYNAAFSDNGGITIEFDNDQNNSDVVIDYIIVNGNLLQAEDQSYNTAVYSSGQCGGSYSEWMHCNGLIGFGETNSGGAGSSDWSDTLFFRIPSAEYALDDINILLRIALLNDLENNLDWESNPDPGSWTGVTWTDAVPKRVYRLDIDNKRLTGNIFAGDLPAMVYLSVGNNYNSSLDIRGSSALTEFYCPFGFLTSLDLSTQYNLVVFWGKFNLLQQINFGTISQLEEISLLKNQLRSVNLEYMYNVETMHIEDNYLTDININNCLGLKYFYAENNNLNSLQVSNLHNLQGISCKSNHLTSIELFDLPALSFLSLSFNDLTSTTGLNTIPNLLELRVDHNKLTSLTVGNLTSLTRLYAENNYLSAVSGLSNLTNLEGLFVSGNMFTHLNFSGLSSLMTIYADNNELTSISGFNDLTSLSGLYVFENDLTYLDLSDLGSVTKVETHFNKLNSIVLPSPSSLEYLDVWGNNLTELNLIGQDSLTRLIADDNKLKSLIISGTRVLNEGAAGVSMNNLPFTELIKLTDAVILRIDPMHEVFDSVISMQDVTIDYSSQAMIEGMATTFNWYKNDVYQSTNTTGIFTTTGNGVYFCRMENGHFPEFTLTSAPTIIGNENSPICNIIVPATSPLPGLSTSYSHMHVVGAGPDLGNVVNFNINWSLSNNRIYDIALNTNNGNPGWYVNLLNKVTHSLASENPDMTISGSGINGLDGPYWVTMDGGNLVLASKTGNFIIYCSNSSTVPCGSKVINEIATLDETYTGTVNIYPNPAAHNVNIEMAEEGPINIYMYSILGETVLQKSATGSNFILDVSGIKSGIYLLKVITQKSQYEKHIIINN